MAPLFAVTFFSLALAPLASPALTWHRAFYPPPCSTVEAIERPSGETKEQAPTVFAPATAAPGKPTEPRERIWGPYDPQSTTGN